MSNRAMLNYAILLLLACLLALSVTAASMAIVLRRIVAPTRRSPAPATVPGVGSDATIPYAPIERRPPLLVRFPWIAAVLCAILGSIPVAVVAGLPWFCLPSPLQPIALAGICVYLFAVGGLLVRGYSGSGAASATRWNTAALLAGCLAALLVSAATLWILDLRTTEKIALQQRHTQEYLEQCRNAQDMEGPPAADLYRKAVDLYVRLPTSPEWDSSLPLTPFPPDAEPVYDLIRQAAQCRRWGQGQTQLASLPRLYALHAAWQARHGQWETAIADLRDLYTLARLHTTRGEVAAQFHAQACVRAAHDLTRFLIAQAQTPQQLASIPLPRTAWYQIVLERHLASASAALLHLPSEQARASGRWQNVLYRVICYDDDAETVQGVADMLAQISRACASPGPFAASIPAPPPPSLLSVCTQDIAAKGITRAIALMDLRVQRDLLELAVTCRQYETRHGRWPKSLQELVDAGLLSEVPTDLWDGGPLICRADGQTLQLVSAGRDSLGQHDDLAVTVANNPRRLVEQASTRPR